jgi:hypothetical protein
MRWLPAAGGELAFKLAGKVGAGAEVGALELFVTVKVGMPALALRCVGESRRKTSAPMAN